MGDYLVPFFVVLASSLPSVRLVVTVNDGMAGNYNAALNQRVSVYPTDVTCLSEDEFLTLYNNDVIYCSSSCERNVSSHDTADVRRPKEVAKVGGIHCHLEDDDQYDENDTIVEQNMTLCWLTLAYGTAPLRQSFTYSAWFKPTDTQPRQSLFSTSEFQILLQEGRLEGITYTIAGKVSHVTQLTKIEPGVWTHIAIRVHLPDYGDNVASNVARTVAVFSNGVFLYPSLQLSTELSDVPEASEQLAPLGVVPDVGDSAGSGQSGASGVSGATGSSGVSGVSGSSGISGATGSSGVSGATGSSGVSGASGSSGVSGASGSSGVSGASGSSGVSGASGSSGVSGATGSSGVSGATGSSGVSGASGTSGISGTTEIPQQHELQKIHIGLEHTRITLSVEHITDNTPYGDNVVEGSIGCEVLTRDECATVGYTPAVRMPNQRSQNLTYIDARQAFLLGVDPDQESRLNNCNWDRDLVARFACAYYFPPCSDTGTVLQPCRSLCTAVMENWCESVDRPPISCETFPDSTDPAICYGENNQPGFGLYSGEIRQGLLYWTLLTDREIEAQYTGRLRPVRPLSECLCDASITPAISKYSSSTCVATGDQSGSQRTSGRLGDGTYYNVEFVNDGYMDTAWASHSLNPPIVQLQIDFERPVQITIIEIHMESRFPDGMEIMTNRSGNFTLMQMISNQCRYMWGKDTDGILYGPDSINCQNLTRLASPSSSSPPFKVTLDLRYKRPDEYNPTPMRRKRRAAYEQVSYEEFLTSSGIQLVFHGPGYSMGTSYIVSEVTVYTRNECGCYEEGTIDDFRCLDRVCQCKDVAGVDVSDAGPKCRPYLVYMIPTFGPRSGGTKVVIFGGFLGWKGSTVSVHSVVEDISFEIETCSNETRVCSVTPPLTNGTKDIMNVPTALVVTLESGYKLTTKMKFTYKEDPVVLSIHPERSFLRGGVIQTVVGRHFDSVAFPLMTVTLVYRGRYYEQPTTACKVVNGEEMHCPTPEIELPSDIVRISKRDLSHFLEGEFNAVTGHSTRTRRAVPPNLGSAGLYNAQDLQFYIGFVLDGVSKYRNLTDTLPRYARLYVYADPDVYEFEREVMPFRTKDVHIVIKGDRLNYGAGIEDYNITVAQHICEVIELTTNQLTCRPPQEKPPRGQFDKNGNPRVKVEVGNIKIVVGFLDYGGKTSNTLRNALIIVGCLLVLLLLIILIALYLYRRRKTLSKAIESGQQAGDGDVDVHHEYIGLKPNKPRDIVKALSPALATKIESARIDMRRMKLGKIIGKGNFGEVHIGQLKDEWNESESTLVAIKTIRDADTVRSVSEFLEEATIMHNFDHPNVLSLLGVVIEHNKPYVIMPLMENGDLRIFIGKRDRILTLRDLLQFGHDVAKGMAYLEDARFVHRDLAARNCMVDDALTVKIADFGLARDIYDDDYYKVQDKYRPLPIKWMAIEALKQSKFTTKSDVWSYGVVLWELMTRGLKPYADVDNLDLKRYLDMGRRLPKPEVTPQHIYDLMEQCWLEDPEKRPSFAEVCEMLGDILSEDVAKTRPEYTNDYLVLVGVSGDRISADGYLPPISSDLDNEVVGETGPQPQPRYGYLPMTGNQNDQSTKDVSSSGVYVNTPVTPIDGNEESKTLLKGEKFADDKTDEYDNN